jgi:pimeloyl-ACP methyl ester carboxylesterase
MPTFVLVHGVWHDGSAWSAAIDRLDLSVYTVFGRIRPGRKPDSSTRISDGDLSRPIVDFVVDHDLTDDVLMGHSFGAAVVCKALDAIADRVRQLFYLAGHVLNDG